MKTREVELYIGYTNNRWETQCVSIPFDTPEEKVEEVATQKSMQEFFNNPRTHDEVAFVGVYHIPSMEEEE
ncbi:hypothetical protein LCGC14_3100520 [marine sediment metagenome]|uniref:Uncharacterized protein n=1 Tax=marine sediment metagenome TaxID=412755 RepID=A0A0F8YY15_9ZZZZ|nr:hypothetical protein [bacterium]